MLLTSSLQAICKEYRFLNCDVTLREDCSADQLIDVIEGWT